MKQALGVVCGGILGLIFLLGSAYAADKFAYVDVTRIAGEYTKAKEYAKNLESKATGFEAEINKKANEVKQLQDKISLLSDKEKENKKTELDAKFKELQEFRRQKETDLRKEDFDNTKEIVEDIKAIIKDHAEKQGFTLVFDDRALVYQTKSMDITDKIIQALNSKVPAAKKK